MEHQARRWLLSIFLTLSLLLGVETRTASGQELGTAAPPDSTQNVPVAQQGSAQPNRTVSLRKLPGNILEDEKGIFLFPKELAKGKHWWPTIGVLGGTVALVASDPYTAPAFRTTTRLNGFNRDLSSVNTAAFIAAVPAAIYGVGWLRKRFLCERHSAFGGRSGGRRIPAGYSVQGNHRTKAAAQLHRKWAVFGQFLPWVAQSG